ncbi:hypothetical protein J3F84DRAFT_379401 [Trichoderma pleuroticola]
MQHRVFRAISLLIALYTTSLIGCALVRNQVSVSKTFLPTSSQPNNLSPKQLQSSKQFFISIPRTFYHHSLSQPKKKKHTAIRD